MNETHDCRKCRKYGTDYDCRENCEGRDMNERFNVELEKLRKELHETAEMHLDGDYYLRDEWIDEYIDKHIKENKQ